MNPYLLLILALLIGETLLDCAAEWLNSRKVNASVPAEFKGVYDEEKYRKSIEYLRVNSRFEILRRSILLPLTVAFLVLGGFNWADRLARSAGLGSIATGLLFIGILGLLRWVTALPFSLYDTFVIEQKFGFNRTTASTYWSDQAKGLILGTILGAPVFAGIVYFFERVGSHAWIYSWAAVTVFQLVLLFVAPVLIMPIFNKFEPLPDGELKKAIEEYTRAQDFSIQGVFTMDGSKRSTKSNAFFTGFGRFRRLVFFDTLLEKHGHEEIMAILAHEIGHYKRKHIPKTAVLSIAMSAALFYVFSLFINNPRLFEAFRMEHLSVYASLVFVSILLGPLMRPVSILGQILSRKFEFEADQYSAKTYGKPEMLISALKKLSVDNLSQLTPHWLKVLLDYSHPPVLERIRVLRGAASVILLCLAFASGAFASTPKAIQPERELGEACAAATAPERYLEFAYIVPKDFKDEVYSYKLKWKAFCDKSGSVKFQDLARALDQLLKDFEKLSGDMEGDESNEGYARFSKMTCHAFPQFIPAFKCLERGDGPQQYREPSLAALARVGQKFGDEEDQRFFASYRQLVGEPVQREIPWRQLYETDAVFQGCLKLESFDWVGAFRKIAALKRSLKREDYRSKIARIEKEMMKELEPSPAVGICGCGPKKEALAMFRGLSKYFSEFPSTQSLSAKLIENVKRLEDGRMVFTNDLEKHCGGG